VGYFFGAYDVHADALFGGYRLAKTTTEVLAFYRSIRRRSLAPGVGPEPWRSALQPPADLRRLLAPRSAWAIQILDRDTHASAVEASQNMLAEPGVRSRIEIPAAACDVVLIPHPFAYGTSCDLTLLKAQGVALEDGFSFRSWSHSAINPPSLGADLNAVDGPGHARRQNARPPQGPAVRSVPANGLRRGAIGREGSAY
jgi:hypothetical protein